MKKHFTKLAGIALAAALTLGIMGSVTPNAQAATTQFSDVKSTHWAYSSINKGISKGYIDGYEDGKFKPDASVTRAEFVKMVVSAMNLQTETASGKWYVEYVNAASKAGLYASADFSNDDAAWTKVMTRDEMARVAARSIGEKTNENDKWMYLAAKSGLIEGVGKGEIAPKGLTTRAQAVVIIERILSKNSGEYLNVDKYAVGSAEILWHGTNIFTVMPEMWVTPESDVKNHGKESVEDMWDESKMTLTSKDGLYQSKLDALIAIDLADPNDPNLSLLPNINTLKWSNNSSIIKDLMIKDHKNSYILYFKGNQVYNKAPKKYLDQKLLTFRVDGFNSPDLDAFYYKRTLNGSALVYQNKWFDLPAIIIPKSGTVQKGDDLVVRLETPTSGSLASDSVILRLRGIQ
ncbi:S-layer homology domain-containing protein [Paenibacillus sp. Y412MC10]|uniref:S-layer homology domain-containing protein n=1 Tax=Geobacillus sp. (strain Y412MC10) TaxID=481743 RepID=UPI0011A76670|nr:S-layer homology domain-containing protein [Paenibacillus sp. Y412MC10]